MIETEDLTKRFGDLIAVDSVSINVGEGEVFGFLGPNGAGKTTTVRMLCCLISKTGGEARIGGYEVGNDGDSLKIRKMIGFVPDNVGLYEALSAYKNLDIFGRLYGSPDAQRRENIQRFLTMLGLWEKKDVAVGGFSKGMKQKLAIARGLIHDPQVIFMDEPTANLDPESAKTVRDFILELKKEKRTIFLNSHNLDEVQRVCDRIAILNTRLIATGTPEELEGMVGSKRTVVQVEKVSDAILAAIQKRIPDSKVTVDGLKIAVDLAEAETRTPDVVQAVVQAGGRVRFAGVVGSTLEDTYLKLVRPEQ
jgi:ABC-2 type transport system ATP-binding protein